MDDMLLRIIKCLLQVLSDHGVSAYRRAGKRALSAVCTVLIEETEGPPSRTSATIVRFRLRNRHPDEDG